ncbi:MAG TPA: DUF5916 domain-containing protein, partial [Bacteroidales bacterium]|nr:DUF5916 domain-containing protein [Bacteroidales bacterium]
STAAITALEQSSARYFQRPGATYVDYDTTATSLSGWGGKFTIGKGAKGHWKYSAGITMLSPGLELNDLGYMNYADDITQTNEVTYLITQPVSIFNSYDITLEQFNSWNFSGNYLGSGGHLAFNSIFKNQWNFSANLIYHSKSLDTRVLRGGYDMKMPFKVTSFGSLTTDQAKKVIGQIQYSYEKSGSNSSLAYEIQPRIVFRPINSLRLSVAANYDGNRDNLQYVDTKAFATGDRYILGRIDQETLGLTFRVDLNITPEFSIQYYGSPFISKGKYSLLKYITNPRAGSYDNRFQVYNTQNLPDGSYLLNDPLYGSYNIANPDFNFHEFRSNLVAKWEYRLGSFIYLVWSSQRSGTTGDPGASFGKSYKELRNIFPDNIFLVKLNYWFSL